MRQVAFNAAAPDDGDGFRRWVIDCINEIELASHETVEEVADAFTVTGLSSANELRTLDASTATTSDIARVLATFISDMHKRGMTRG